jgi:DNA topoisomerase-1
MENKVLFPTDTAEVVNNLLVSHFADVVDLQFTANMENDLDRVAEGEKEWVPFLREFYTPFDALVAEKDKSIKKEDVVNEATDEICEECGKPMVIKLGRMGKFMSCSDYPTCKNAKPIGEDSEEVKALKEKFKDAKCEKCGAQMDVKSSRYGEFLGCSAYPKCKTTQAIVKSTGVTCPCCEKHDMVEKKGGRGRSSVFYGCQGYPECDYLSRYKPLRGPDEGDERKGFYFEKKGEEDFYEFDPEAWAKQKERNAARKKKKEEASSK